MRRVRRDSRLTERANPDLLQFAFETRHLRTICEDSAEAIKELGEEVAYALMACLADLDSADSIHDVLLGRPRTQDNGEVEIELTSDYRLLCRANHPTNPTMTSGAIDWNKVSRIKIVRISNS